MNRCDFQVKLEEEMEDLTWPIATRNAVFELEALFALSNVKICFQCGRPQSWHTKTCVPNSDTRMYPATDGVLQKEFLRKSLLIWLLFEKEDQFDAFTCKYKIVALKLKLREYFNNIKMKKEEDRTPVEKIIAAIETIDDFIIAFCESIAKVWEESSYKVKRYRKYNHKILKLRQFGDIEYFFAVILLNIFGNNVEDGDKVEYENKLTLSVKCAEFIPQHLRSN